MDRIDWIILGIINEATRSESLRNLPIGSVKYGESLTDAEFGKNGKKNDKWIKKANPKMHREVDYIPNKKMIIGYKLFNYNPKTPGVVYPLYVNTGDDANTMGMLKIGKWYEAGEGEMWVREDGLLKVRSKLGLLAYRPGWHLSDLPKADHIGPKVDGKQMRGMYQVFAKCEIVCDDDSWDEKAKAQSNVPAKQFLREIPKNGYYCYKTNSKADDDEKWYIADKIRIVSILSDDETDEINDAHYGNDKHRGLKRIGGRLTREILTNMGF